MDQVRAERDGNGWLLVEGDDHVLASCGDGDEAGDDAARVAAALNERTALTAERDALRQAAMRLLTALVDAETEAGAAEPLACLREVQAAEEALEDLVPADVWAAFHAAREGRAGAR